MIYLDNSATSRIKPKQVINAVVKGLTRYNANPGRGGHTYSIECAMQVNLVREKVRKFFNGNKIENIIFTSGCTEALNLAILGSAKKGHVIATVNDHNSVLRPLHYLKNQGLITLDIVSPQKEDILEWEDIKPYIKSDTYLICTNHMSNVDGMITNINEIGKHCKELGILFLVDGAQSTGHIKIDMQEDNIDFLAIAPHKGLYAPQGIGVLVINDAKTLKPIKFGGTGTESFSPMQPTSPPECFESGTLAVPNILGLGAGIDFVDENFNDIVEKIEDLTTYLNFELRKINNVIVYTHPNNAYGVVSFVVKGQESESVCNILNERYKICARSGLQCAPLKHKDMGTLETGTVRISISYFNTFGEIITLIKAIKHIAKHKEYT